MSDMDDDDLSRFLDEDDDKVKPIDTGGEQANTTASADPGPEKKETDKGVPPFPESDVADTDIPKPVFDDNVQPPEDVVISSDLMDDIEKESGLRTESAGENSDEEGFKVPSPNENQDEEEEDDDEVPAHLKAHDTEINFLKRGEYMDLKERRPGLTSIMIGGGWDQRSFEEVPLDLDLSLFLLDKTEMTRDDSDFVFYNNKMGCDGAIRHNYDSRTGAGDGDDETIDVDLNGIPFTVLKIVVVISIYDPEFHGYHFGKVKNVFVRIVDKSDGLELFRYQLEDDFISQGNALIVGTLIREGPKWIFEANSSEPINGGLANFATDYGIIVKELQSTGIEEDGATERSDD